MEVVNFFDHPRSDSMVHWLLVESAGKFFEKAGRFSESTFDAKNIEIEFKVNGEELPFVEFMEEVERQFDRSVNERAKELITERFSPVLDKLYDIEEDMKNSFPPSTGD